MCIFIGKSLYVPIPACVKDEVNLPSYGHKEEKN